MKNIRYFSLVLFLFLFIKASVSQVITIDSARAEDANGVSLLLNQTVTVRGVVTTHRELGGSLVYFQVPTAGIVGFDTAFCNHVTRGDSVQATGVITQYNGLTEFNPVSSYTVLGSNRPFSPIVVTPGTLRNATGEQYEGRLIKINGVTAIHTTAGANATTWAVTGSGTNYRLLVGTDSVDIRIYATSNIANTPIMAFPFSVVAEQSQFCSSPPYLTGYQIIPRDLNDFTVFTGVNQISNEVPKSYSLSQNYPNPFNPVTKITFSLPANANGSAIQTKLVVYDILGKEIKELVNSTLTPGTYEAEFNASDFASGVYMYSLIINGSRIDSKKLVVNK